MEHFTRQGSSVPLHRHRHEDEIFHMLSGEARFVMDGQETMVSAGQTLIVAKGVPHTFVVTSPDGARWLTITRGYFERILRAVARPAERDEMPVQAGPPTAEQMAALRAACAANEVDILGPPMRLAGA